MRKQFKVNFFIGIGITAFIAVLVGMFLFGGSVVADSMATNALPMIEFLGEGPGEFNTSKDEFIVKRGRATYDFEPGGTYNAASGEKVWAVSGANSKIQLVMDNSVYPLGPANQGCFVEYVGIDDDINTVRNGFFVGSTLVELVVEGMTFGGDFVIPHDSTQFRFVAEEDLAMWFTPCEEVEPTATPEPVETPTPNPDVDVQGYLPIVVNQEAEEPPPPPTPTPDPDETPPPDSYTVTCDQDYSIRFIGDEVEYNFEATAYRNGDPFADVSLMAEVDPGSGTPASGVDETNSNGVADFRLETLISNVTQTPIATVTFEDQGSYGNASCTISFDEAPPPPTATPLPPPGSFDVVCDQDYDIRIIGEEVDFEFSATAYYDGYLFSDVDLRGTLEVGGATPFNVEETNFNGVADFNITVLITTITQTPVVTVTFDDQATYGDASCTIDFSGSNIDWASLQ